MIYHDPRAALIGGEIILATNYHKSVSRTVVVTHCRGQCVNGGVFLDLSAEMLGRYTLKRAQAKLRRELADPSITLNAVEYDEAYYTMPLDQFLKLATRKEKTK